MLVFPKVNRKLPELFEIIIDHDRRIRTAMIEMITAAYMRLTKNTK